MKSPTNHALKKQYLDKIRFLLPVYRREEKEYLRRLELNVDEVLENEDVSALSSMDDYYRTFGEPSEIVRQYYSTLNTDSVYSIIRFRKLTTGLIFAACIAFIVAIVILCAIAWQQHQLSMREEAVFIDYEIRISEEDQAK